MKWLSVNKLSRNDYLWMSVCEMVVYEMNFNDIAVNKIAVDEIGPIK